MLRHFPTLLARWCGSYARLWELTSSHPTLTILLEREETPGCLVVQCLSPERIEAPRTWHDSDLRIEKAQESFNVLDTAAGVKVLECGVILKEHPKKLWE